MIKYISALTLALFSLSAAAQNASVSEAQPVSQPHELQHVLVAQAAVEVEQETVETNAPGAAAGGVGANQLEAPVVVDRKSTRLNSSHVAISYAVFCLKKTRNHTE